MERETKNTKENNLPTRCSSVGAATDQWLGLPPRPRFRSALGMRLFTRGKAEVDQAARFRFSQLSALASSRTARCTCSTLRQSKALERGKWDWGIRCASVNEEMSSLVIASAKGVGNAVDPLEVEPSWRENTWAQNPSFPSPSGKRLTSTRSGCDLSGRGAKDGDLWIRVDLERDVSLGSEDSFASSANASEPAAKHRADKVDVRLGAKRAVPRDASHFCSESLVQSMCAPCGRKTPSALRGSSRSLGHAGP